jgi:hypothetical protein
MARKKKQSHKQYTIKNTITNKYISAYRGYPDSIYYTKDKSITDAMMFRTKTAAMETLVEIGDNNLVVK